MERQQGNGWVALGCVLAGIAVGAGALGAHALETRLDPAELEDWHTAVRYQFFHALALVLYGLWNSQRPERPLVAEGRLFLAGTIAFSGSIYLLVFGIGSSWVWPLTPLGGFTLLAGWVVWGIRAMRVR